MKAINVKYGGFEAEQQVDESLYDVIYNKAIEDFISYSYLNGIDFSFMGKIENGESTVPKRLKKIKDNFMEERGLDYEKS